MMNGYDVALFFAGFIFWGVALAMFGLSVLWLAPLYFIVVALTAASGNF